jgi:hypothetical protein
MKIIAKSNFDNESVSDILVAENVPQNYALQIVKLMNDHLTSETGPYYYHVVEDQYKLYEFKS